VVAVLLRLLNVLLIVAVHGRKLGERVRGRRAARFQASFERTLAELQSERPDQAWLRRQLRALGKLERPIAARMLIEKVRTAPAEQCARILGVLRTTRGRCSSP
jgi:hypothetical protein